MGIHRSQRGDASLQNVSQPSRDVKSYPSVPIRAAQADGLEDQEMPCRLLRDWGTVEARQWLGVWGSKS